MSNRRQLRGFSLIEIMVALVLIGLLLAISIPSISALSGAEMRRGANQVASVIRDTYMRAAYSGGSYRLAFDLTKNQYWVESSSDRAVVRSEDDEDEGAIAGRPKFKALEDEAGEKKTLEGDIKLSGFFSDQFDAIQTKDVVYLYFYPEGYTQDAFIEVSRKDKKDELYVVVDALTGECVVEAEKPEIPR